jgi:SAM-dependent methyltransferase
MDTQPMTYQLLSRYYDLENADFTEDLDFWLSLAEDHGDPVLELGCGSGRVLLYLARRGHAVTGIDNSPEMLALLEGKLKLASAKHLATPPAYLLASLHDFQTPTRFKLAIMPFNTFMHLLTPEAQLAALANIRRHLAPGAALALDMPNPTDAYAAQEQGVMLERTFKDGERTVQQFSSVALDRAAQLAHITWFYDAVSADGAVQRTVVPLTLRYTFQHEMRLLLDRCGFSLDHLYGDYDCSPFADGAPRMLVVATAA